MLKDALYHIFVYPLESLLSFVLSLLYGYCGSHGLSIIFLSLLVNLFLLKLFFIADRASKNHSLIKSKLDIKIAEFKRVFKGGELYAYIKTLYRQNHYHPIYALKALGGLALQVPFFVAVVSLLEFHSPELKGIGFGVIPDLLSPDGLLGGINFLPLLMTFFTLCNVWISSSEKGARIQGSVIALIFLVLLYKMPSALLLYWTTSMVFALLKSVCVKYIQLTHKEGKESKKESQTFFLKIFSACFTKHADLSPQDYKLYRNISIFAILNLCTLIFLYNPFALYASDVSQFDPKETWNTLGALFGFFLLTSFLLIYSTSFFYRTRLLKIWTCGFCVVLMIALVYNFVLDYNVVTGESYGQLDSFVFKKESAFIYTKMNYLVDFCLFMLTVLVVVALKLERLVRVCKFILYVIMFIVLVFIFQIYFDNKKALLGGRDRHIDLMQNQENKDVYPQSLFSLSKTKQNILIIMSDAFTGEHMLQILKSHPEYKKFFSGFTFYPNTLSSDGHTMLTAHNVLLGHTSTPLANFDTSLDGYANRMDNRLLDLMKQYSKAYDVQIFGIPYISDKTEKEYRERQINVYRDIRKFYPNFIEKHKERLEHEKLYLEVDRPTKTLVSIGLFYTMPYMWREKVYKDKKWIFAGDSEDGAIFYNGLQNVAVLDGMIGMFKNDSKRATFKYLYTPATHAPFVLDDKCKPSVGALRRFKNNFAESHYMSEDCAVKNFYEIIQELKNKKVYNNTMIIFVSDHSYNDLSISQVKLGNGPNPLLMIKFFNSTGDLKIDNRLMSNADIAGIICDYSYLNGKCEGVEKNILKSATNERELYHTMNIHWTKQAKVSNHLLFGKIWKVKDNIYDPKNWKDVTKEFLDNLNKKEDKK